MRLVTYSSGPNGPPRLGVRVGHRVLDVEAASRVDGEPLPNTLKALLREGRGALSRVQALAKAAQASAGRFSASMHEERAIRFLPPVPDAGRFACGARSRDASSLVGHNAKVAKSREPIACAPALVFVLGRSAAGTTEDDDPRDYIAGVTLMLEFSDPGASGGMPSLIGPELVTFDEIGDLEELWVSCAVNGESRARASLHEHASGLPALLAKACGAATMEPGDMFATTLRGGSLGAAAADLELAPGDVVECTLEGLTTLRASVVAS